MMAGVNPDGTCDMGFLSSDPGTIFTINFKSREFYCRFAEQLDNIRQHNQATLRLIRGNPVPFRALDNPAVLDRISEFIQMCRALAASWGYGAIPPDVRFAWNDGEDVLDHTLTVFDDTLRGGILRVGRLAHPERGTVPGGKAGGGGDGDSGDSGTDYGGAAVPL